jgi:mitochondrial fission protein ELM1
MSHEVIDTACLDGPPRVWAILCYRAGDNAQILALAEALGWPFEIKRLVYREREFLSSVLRGTSLKGIDESRSSPLRPPWPDLIISAAFRNEPVCRWIQRQADKRVRYVHIGRPWARLKHFDLVVTVPEFRLPERPNVVQTHLSLNRVEASELVAAARLWEPRLNHLPRPYIAVLVGGYGGPYAFGRAEAERLGREASAVARQAGGSLLVTSSSRTRPAAMESLAAVIDVPAHIFRWSRNAAENPYLGFLALADDFIVTCDSAMMLAEACATRKPVYIFDLGEGARPVRSWLPPATPNRHQYRRWQRWELDHLKAFLYRQLMRIRPRRLTRDIRLVHRFLIASGRAAWLGERFPQGLPPPPLDDIERSVARVRALFNAEPGPPIRIARAATR